MNEKYRKQSLTNVTLTYLTSRNVSEHNKH